MKALQSLIPNSNKTDKASMLDEAIEYLKQLQLQVQMLSMRNGVYLNPPHLSCALEPVQASQMFAALGGGNITASSTGAVMPPVNQSSGTHQAFDPLNPPQNQPLSFLLPSVPDKTIPERQFHLEPSQSHLQTFRMPESSEMMLRGEIMAKHQLMFSVSARLLVHGQQNYKYCSISLRMEIVAKAPMVIASTV